MIFMTGDAQIRSIFIDRGLPICIDRLFKRGTVGIVANRAIHTAFVVCADFPFLPAKARVAVTLAAGVGGIINGHGAVRVICWGLAMAGFAGYTISLPCGRVRIITCDMACKASARLTLICPGLYKDRVVSGMCMRTAHPGGLKFGVAGSTIKRSVLGWRIAILRLYCY